MGELAIVKRELPAGLDAMTVSGMLAKSGFFGDAKEQAQAFVKVLAGMEMGIGPIEAMTGIYVINGRVAMGSGIMSAQIKRSGRYNYRVKELTDTACSLDFFEGGEFVGNSRFTFEDAKKAGTKNLDKFPRNMLFARALSNGAKWYTPDAFAGPIYTPEELKGGGGTDEAPPTYVEVDTTTGEVIEAESTPATDESPHMTREEHAAAVKELYTAAGASAVKVIDDLNRRFHKGALKELTDAEISYLHVALQTEAEEAQ